MHGKCRKGLSLIELILFLGVIGLMVGTVAAFSIMSRDVETKGALLAQVEQGGDLVTRHLVKTVEDADAIAFPEAGSSDDILILTRVDASFEQTWQGQYEEAGGIRLIENASTINHLIPQDVGISFLLFLHGGGGGSPEFVSFAFELYAKERGVSPLNPRVVKVFYGTAFLHPRACASDADCTSPDECCGGVCRPKCITPQTCATDSDCAGGKVCCIQTLGGGLLMCESDPTKCQCQTVSDCPQTPSCDDSTCSYSVPFCDTGTNKCAAQTIGKCPSCSRCGDGWKDEARGEECDDGNANNNDSCTNICTTSVCGDGIIQSAEQCDDGNARSGDGCSGGCQDENLCSGARDGVADFGEQCDDGNAVDNDTCDNNCRVTVCGDGAIQSPNGRGRTESCDDGNTLFRDGCSGACVIEATGCGNGIKEGAEACDDGKRCAGNDGNPDAGNECYVNSDCSSGSCAQSAGDGCSNSCTREDACGDDVVTGSEVCDDGGVCTGSAVASFNGVRCDALDPGGNALYGVQRCRATGGSCVQDARGGCAADCAQQCRTQGQFCFRDEDCFVPDTMATPCAACVNQRCSAPAAPACGDGTVDLGEACDDGRRCTASGNPCIQDSDCPGATNFCVGRSGDGCTTPGGEPSTLVLTFTIAWGAETIGNLGDTMTHAGGNTYTYNDLTNIGDPYTVTVNLAKLSGDTTIEVVVQSSNYGTITSYATTNAWPGGRWTSNPFTNPDFPDYVISDSWLDAFE